MTVGLSGCAVESLVADSVGAVIDLAVGVEYNNTLEICAVLECAFFDSDNRRRYGNCCEVIALSECFRTDLLEVAGKSN